MSCDGKVKEYALAVEAIANGLLAAREGPERHWDGWLRDLQAEARSLAARMRTTLPAKKAPETEWDNWLRDLEAEGRRLMVRPQREEVTS